MENLECMNPSHCERGRSRKVQMGNEPARGGSNLERGSETIGMTRREREGADEEERVSECEGERRGNTADPGRNVCRDRNLDPPTAEALSQFP